MKWKPFNQNRFGSFQNSHESPDQYDGDPDYYEAHDYGDDRYGGHAYEYGQESGGMLQQVRNLLNWDEVASEIIHESQARLAIVGLSGSGKNALFNRLRGWAMPETEPIEIEPEEVGIQVEPYGTFVLGRLPFAADAIFSGMDIGMALGEPHLVVYLLDGECGVRGADYRWVSMLRHSGRPLVVALNKCDLIADPQELQSLLQEAEQKLGCQIVPISALYGTHIEEQLLPAVLHASPKLTIPLAREIASLRRTAARRVIHQTAALAGLISTQPIPLLDIPFQAALHVGLVMRIGAAYGRPAASGMNRENLGAVFSTLAIRYAAQTALKFLPLLGWAASGAIGWAATFAMGELTIRYYESDSQKPWSTWISSRPHLRPSKQLSWDWFQPKPITYLHNKQQNGVDHEH